MFNPRWLVAIRAFGILLDKKYFGQLMHHQPQKHKGKDLAAEY